MSASPQATEHPELPAMARGRDACMIGRRASADRPGTVPAAVLHPLSANARPSGARLGADDGAA